MTSRRDCTIHATTVSKMTTSLIPCCTCGTIIAPNPSNQCASCLAPTVDVATLVNRGPGGGNLVLGQCRKCRRFDRTGEGKYYAAFEQESPKLMAALLKRIPALGGGRSGGQQCRKSHGVEALHLMDAMWIWTEPHSMRMRLALTLRADINETPRTVSIQQRVKVEFKVQWQECPDCTKESRQRTWQAIVQLRQKRSQDSGSRKGLLILEMAVARNAEMRRHILSVKTKKNGFDFYFAALDKARHFAAYLTRAAPMRTKTSQSLVSADVKNNTANVRHTVVCDMVPLCRDDLIVSDRHTSKGAGGGGGKGVGRLSGRLCLVIKMSSVVHLVDASPPRGGGAAHCLADLHAENYWKGGGDKTYRVFASSNRLVRFVVLDVELCDGERRGGDDRALPRLFKGSNSGVNKYALADVEVVRESDFGANDLIFRCVTHLGNLVSVGDIVLGYDLASIVLSGEAEWSAEHAFNSSFVMPDVVLVRKVKGSGGGDRVTNDALASEVADEGIKKNGNDGKDKAKSSASKKRERRMKKEEQKRLVLEETAARMGLNLDDSKGGIGGEDYAEAVLQEKAALEWEVKEDEALAEDLELMERELAGGEASDSMAGSDVVEGGEEG